MEKLQLDFKPIYSVVSTAAGKRHRLLGKISLEITFRNKTLPILFYLCPDLEQGAY